MKSLIMAVLLSSLCMNAMQKEQVKENELQLTSIEKECCDQGTCLDREGQCCCIQQFKANGPKWFVDGACRFIRTKKTEKD